MNNTWNIFNQELSLISMVYLSLILLVISVKLRWSINSYFMMRKLQIESHLICIISTTDLITDMQNHSVSEDLKDDIPTDIPIFDPSPPPTTPEALNVLTNLTNTLKHSWCPPLSTLQHPTAIRNTSDIVCSLQSIALSLKSYQLNNRQQQTLHGWLQSGSSSWLLFGEEECQGGFFFFACIYLRIPL
ncbi:hypothetical protein BGX38DRAFT_819082 [Terfezia claveryi]|nr:hypothetical protein BGX38DRAFT_819082 [Terfezia claveryi]